MPTLNDLQRMRAEPVNIKLRELVERLLAGRTVVIWLEPGDATRYDLILAPVLEGGVISELGVIRTTGAGGDFRSAAVLPYGPTCEEWYQQSEIARLAGVSEWTAILLSWWFAQLWERIDNA